MADTHQKQPLSDATLKSVGVDFLNTRYDHLCRLAETRDTAALADEIGRVHAELQRRGHSRAVPAAEFVRPLGVTSPARSSIERAECTGEQAGILIRKAIDDALFEFNGGPITVRDVRRFLLGPARADELTFAADIRAALADRVAAGALEVNLTSIVGEWRIRAEPEQDTRTGMQREHDAAVLEELARARPTPEPTGPTDELAAKAFGVDAETIYNALYGHFRTARINAAELCGSIAKRLELLDDDEGYEKMIERADSLVREANRLRATLVREHHAFLGSTDF